MLRPYTKYFDLSTLKTLISQKFFKKFKFTILKTYYIYSRFCNKKLTKRSRDNDVVIKKS